MLANIARMFSDTQGQDDLHVTDVVPGFRSLTAAGLVDGLTYSYGVEADYVLFDGIPIPQSRETGRGVWDSGTQILTRASHIKSTDGDGVKLMLAGDAEVFITAIEEDFVSLGGLGTYQIKTDAGNIAVAVRDYLIVVNKAVGQATGITLPASAHKLGPVTIKDLKGDAFSNNITVTPDGAETIDGESDYVMDSNKECRQFDPMPDGSGWFIKI